MEASNTQDLDTYLANQSEDVEFVLPGGIVLRGHDQVGPDVQAQWAAFPDGNLTVVKQIATEDEVATEILLTGTYTGPLSTPNGPIQPTGKRVSIRFQSFHRIDREKAASEHVYFDQLEFMTQLGLSTASDNDVAGA
jgi:steroid delta-isomerase-like uncharacterized protein